MAAHPGGHPQHLAVLRRGPRIPQGRLLLRGPNGSGKSKALELLLPYLLDASLKPSRLSTFGGSERTMHWNLMGDGHTGKTRVGYVWLEFAHGSRWFTCGARLQATANTKNVTVAYFSTGQRVGVPGGLNLIGDGGQPSPARISPKPSGRTARCTSRRRRTARPCGGRSTAG